MSLKHSLLALLGEGNRYGYELRQHFEDRTGGAWPLNIGQVYTTLDRLVRDGLVTRDDDADSRQVHYTLTDAGRAAVDAWWDSPSGRQVAGRDDVALKIALAVDSSTVDVARVIQTERVEAMRSLQDLNRAARAARDGDPTWELISDALIFRTEAEIRWLDHAEQRLALRRAGRTGPRAAAVAQAEPALEETR
ncbi:MAG: PadR family transcriptional regulator [Demequina sp.]|jgi:DNA-binding PadR family transcriptional regulator|nr:PadR family transcriptional regulator [Demequina sp.]